MLYIYSYDLVFQNIPIEYISSNQIVKSPYKSQVTNGSIASVMLESDVLFRGVEKGGGSESLIA
jgi:hypothetical protein